MPALGAGIHDYPSIKRASSQVVDGRAKRGHDGSENDASNHDACGVRLFSDNRDFQLSAKRLRGAGQCAKSQGLVIRIE